jgi:hypothetical protein
MSLSSQITGVPLHVPSMHTSPLVQGMPSLHPVLSGLVGLVQIPVWTLHVPAEWHWLSATQTFGVPVQVPDTHSSSRVHAFPSLQSIPSGLSSPSQSPVSGLHDPAWQGSVTVHTTWSLPTHTPSRQVSTWVHRSLSLQGESSARVGFEQMPVSRSQTPAEWHWSMAVQTTGAPAHWPSVHSSFVVHALRSSH